MAIGLRDKLSRCPSEAEWEELYAICQQQAVAGVVFPALDQLGRQGQKAPQHLLFDWIGLSEQVKARNVLMNREAARLTRMFEGEGHRTAILKGQANARLYTDHLALLRQPGDIDIWVDGGREKVIDMLMRTGLIDEAPVFSNVGNPEKATASYHHVELPVNEQGVTVEVHFRPSSGNYNPITNRRLQKFLMRTMDEKPTEEGFNVPSIGFALVMQLAHIQRHFMDGGIGMRQIMDYYYLLKSNTNRTNDTNGIGHTESTDITERLLRNLGLEKMAGAVMWVLGKVMKLDKQLMICEPDAWRGEWLLRDVMSGGNFGRYANSSDGLWRRFFKARMRQLKMIWFSFWEGVWSELFYWKNFIKRIPLRIKYRTLSLSRMRIKVASPQRVSRRAGEGLMIM